MRHDERIVNQFGASLCDVLKTQLETLGTQGAVADALGVSQAWVSRAMYRCGLSRLTTYALSDAYGEFHQAQSESAHIGAGEG